MPQSIIDPRLSADLENYFPAKCTAQFRNDTIGPGGEVPGVPTDVPGIINIPCRIGPMILIRPTDTEQRIGRATTEVKSRQLKMNGYFPQIDASTMQMKVNGVVYRILGNEEDGDRFSTRIRLEIIRP